MEKTFKRRRGSAQCKSSVGHAHSVNVFSKKSEAHFMIRAIDEDANTQTGDVYLASSRWCVPLREALRQNKRLFKSTGVVVLKIEGGVLSPGCLERGQLLQRLEPAKAGHPGWCSSGHFPKARQWKVAGWEESVWIGHTHRPYGVAFRVLRKIGKAVLSVEKVKPNKMGECIRLGST